MPYGVTREMIDAWGGVVFDLSLNRQVRTGDPVRKLDHGAWASQRDETGLSDDEIAARVGLARPQVTFIRNLLERRVFRTNQYRKLYRLGGGKRWREDEYVDPEAAYAIGPEAALLRQALAFDRDRVADWVRTGAWSAETAWDRIATAARDHADRNALVAGDDRLTWGELAGAAETIARGLVAHGVGRGEAVALSLSTGSLPPGPLAAMVLGAVWRLGGVVLVVPKEMTGAALADLLHRARVRAVVHAPEEAEPFARAAAMLPALTLLATPAGGEGIVSLGALAKGGPARPAPPVAGDPALLLSAEARGGGARSGASLAPHTHHTFLAGARSLFDVARGTLGTAPTALGWDDPWSGPGFAAVLGLWLATGATLTAGGKSGDAWSIEPAESAVPQASRLRLLGSLGGSIGGSLDILTGAATQTLLTCGADASWRAAPGVELRCGEDGRLEGRGPAMAPALVDDPAATAERFLPGGWVRTGIPAALDGDIVSLEDSVAPAA